MRAPKFIWLAPILATITAVPFAGTTHINADAVTSFLGNDEGDVIIGWDSKDPKPPNTNYGDPQISVS